jgi:undecaprenyl-diphosphatase
MPQRLQALSRDASPRFRLALFVSLPAAGVVLVPRPADAAELVRVTTSATGDLLTWWKAAILGVVEGITEYLPISSTGHLLVAARLLDLPSAKGSAGLDAVNTYVVAIQFGAILAVLGLFWKRFRDMILGLFGRNEAGRHLLFVLVIAFLPSAVVGVVLDKKIEDTLFGPWPVVAAWIVGGVLILFLERTGRIPDRGERAAPGTDPLLSITYRQALIIGFAQCIALWPGTSRSLTTILAALLLGVAVPAAVEFSFLLGFATLSAATLFKLAKDGGNLVDQFGVVTPLIGAFFAFVSAVLAIKWLITYLERHDLSIFAYYRFVVAFVTIGLLLGGAI